MILPKVDEYFTALSKDEPEILFRRVSEEALDFKGSVGPCVRASRLSVNDGLDKLSAAPSEWVRISDIVETLSKEEALARLAKQEIHVTFSGAFGEDLDD